MKVKLSELFIPLSDRDTYSLKELSELQLQPSFIKKIAARFGLSFITDNAVEGNLCFAQHKDVRPAYRETFSKEEIMGLVLPQILNPVVDLEQKEVIFPDNSIDLFSASFKKTIISQAKKKQLRQITLEWRDKLPREERNALSVIICRHLWGLIQEKNARIIHSYLTMGSEVNVLPLLQKALDHNITVVAPKALQKRQFQNLIVTDLTNMEAGVFNTYYPKDAVVYTGEYDLILVAGLVFDQVGHRIGYGGGYYDAFLAEHPNALKVGIGFPFQFVEGIPVEKHDIKLDKVMTAVSRHSSVQYLKK